jgi:putative RecB family exonuclease
MKKLTVLGQTLDVRLSPSFIQNAACPLYLRCRYVDKVDERYVRVAAARGSAAHAAIAELTRHCLEKEIQPSSLKDDQIRAAVQKHTPALILSEVGAIFGWLKLWADRFKISKHLYGYEERVALDEQYQECSWDEAAYRGILDLIDIERAHCTVTDYKSQPLIMSQTELDEHEQMTMYCWLASKLYDFIDRFTVRIWYLRYGFYAETSRTLEDIEMFEHALKIKESKILEIADWDPVPGKHCQYCEYIHLCPLSQRDGLGTTPIITQEQAVEAAQRITVMDAYLKELKSKLKLYINHNDDVRVGNDWIYGFRHLEATFWDSVDVERILADFQIEGHALSEVTNIDKRKMGKLLKELAKENPALESELAEAVKVRHETRFEGYKPRDGSDGAEVD